MLRCTSSDLHIQICLFLSGSSKAVAVDSCTGKSVHLHGRVVVGLKKGLLGVLYSSSLPPFAVFEVCIYSTRQYEMGQTLGLV